MYTMFLAKPNSFNSKDQKTFKSMFDASDYLNAYGETEVKLDVDEWIAIGKLLEIAPNGSLSTPKYFPKYKYDRKTKTRRLVMEKFSMEAFL